MHITDPIADMLTRIRNANSRKARYSRYSCVQHEKGNLLRFLLMKVISKAIQ